MNAPLKSTILFFLFSGIIWAAQQTKISCIGNSITAQSNGYVVKLGTLLGTAYKVENDGVSATTLLKNGDTPYWTKGKFTQVFAFQPNIVTIKLGTNDTKPQNWDSHYGEFKRDYLAMIDTLGTLASKPKIWIVLPIPIFSNTFGIRDSALKKILVILKQIGQERNLPIIDANTPLLNHTECFLDGVHPNPAGADTIAHVFYRALMSATPANGNLHSIAQSWIPEVAMEPNGLKIALFEKGIFTAQILDLRGSIIYTRTFQTPGCHFLHTTYPLHGNYIVRIRNERRAILYKQIIIP